ncbi:MAG: TraV family lipoprotein [Candidatus Bathyarchaeia archaeon]
MRRLLSLLSVCAVLWGCGAKFTCPAPRGGITCTPVSTVYERYRSGELDTGKVEERKEEESVVRSLRYESMVPVRVPPRIVRIWVAPFEDEDGDLNQGGYIYTEISPGKWSFGEKAPGQGKFYDFFRLRTPLETKQQRQGGNTPQEITGQERSCPECEVKRGK